MGHSYTIDKKTKKTIEYSKRHDNGEETTVRVKAGVGPNAIEPQWEVRVLDPNGNKHLGHFDSKDAARKRATRWMNNHPKGVSGSISAVGAVGKMDETAGSIFTGGGMFE